MKTKIVIAFLVITLVSCVPAITHPTETPVPTISIPPTLAHAYAPPRSTLTPAPLTLTPPSVFTSTPMPVFTPIPATSSPEEPTAIDIILQPVAFNLSIFITPLTADNKIKIIVRASKKLSDIPETYLTQNGANGELVDLSYDANLQIYTGTSTLNTELPASGNILVEATDTSNNAAFMDIQFALEAVTSGKDSMLHSSDGHATLYLPAGSLSADGHVSIADAQEFGSMPDGMILLDGPYTLQGNEGLALVSNANLSLTYMMTEEELSLIDINSAKIYFWDGKSWQALSTTSDYDHHDVSAPIKTFGTYALLVYP